MVEWGVLDERAPRLHIRGSRLPRTLAKVSFPHRVSEGLPTTFVNRRTVRTGAHLASTPIPTPCLGTPCRGAGVLCAHPRAEHGGRPAVSVDGWRCIPRCDNGHGARARNLRSGSRLGGACVGCGGRRSRVCGRDRPLPGRDGVVRSRHSIHRVRLLQWCEQRASYPRARAAIGLTRDHIVSRWFGADGRASVAAPVASRSAASRQRPAPFSSESCFSGRRQLRRTGRCRTGRRRGLGPGVSCAGGSNSTQSTGCNPSPARHRLAGFW